LKWGEMKRSADVPLSKGSLGVSTNLGGVIAAMFLGGLLFDGLGVVASSHSAWLQIGSAQERQLLLPVS
jgi:hypothetical protein